MNRLLLSGLSVLALISTAAASNTWYVDINGTAPGTGTLANPYTRIQYALSQPTTLGTDTVLVAPGTYVENILITNSVHIQSTGGPLVTSIYPAHQGHVVSISSQSLSLSLEGFTVHTAIPPAQGGPLGDAVRIETGALGNCIVLNTSGPGRNGVFVLGDAQLLDCTITGTDVGVFLNTFGGSLSMHNSIVTGNQTDVFTGSQAVVDLQYCAGIANLDANLYGQGNLSGDVGFWDLAHGDLHLRPGSQCIDHGDPTSPLDPDGSRHDIGALTFNSSYAPAPTSYCSGKLNSQGCVPAIGAIGSASATSGAPFVITASNEVANKPGLLLQGFSQSTQPFQGGVLCIQSPIKRLGVQNSGGAGVCTGSYTFDMAGYITGGVHPGLVPGALVDCQWWSRDPLDPAGFGSGLSDALSFGIAP